MQAAANLARKGSAILREKKAAMAMTGTQDDIDVASEEPPSQQQPQLLSPAANDSTLTGGATMQKSELQLDVTYWKIHQRAVMAVACGDGPLESDN
jgi:hypothetical protein